MIDKPDYTYAMDITTKLDLGIVIVSSNSRKLKGQNGGRYQFD